jgi:hypothetical protein
MQAISQDLRSRQIKTTLFIWATILVILLLLVGGVIYAICKSEEEDDKELDQRLFHPSLKEARQLVKENPPSHSGTLDCATRYTMPRSTKNR